jgi:hypothetical protein
MPGKEKGVAVVKLQPLYFTGADEQDRTADLLITNQLLYRLSYIGPPPYDGQVLEGIACLS